MIKTVVIFILLLISSMCGGIVIWSIFIYFEFNKIDSAFMSGLFTQMCWQTFNKVFYEK